MPRRGEIWLVDLGMAQKVRPALILNVPYQDADRAHHNCLAFDGASRFGI